LVPFGEEQKLASVVKTFESMPNIIVALEMTSLEDAYIKIVKSHARGPVKDDESLLNE
jgi:CBS domain-containing protein